MKQPTAERKITNFRTTVSNPVALIACRKRNRERACHAFLLNAETSSIEFVFPVSPERILPTNPALTPALSHPMGEGEAAHPWERNRACWLVIPPGAGLRTGMSASQFRGAMRKFNRGNLTPGLSHLALKDPLAEFAPERAGQGEADRAFEGIEFADRPLRRGGDCVQRCSRFAIAKGPISRIPTHHCRVMSVTTPPYEKTSLRALARYPSWFAC